MKRFCLPLLLLTIFNDFAHTQVSRAASEPLKVEWKRELSGEYTGASGLILRNEKVYITATGDQTGSALNIFSSTGDLLFNSTTYARIRSFFAYQNALYSMGDERITKRDLSGNIVEEKMLPLSENGNISSRNGKILNGKAYTTHLHSYFVKFSLTGEQLFKKTIGSCDNHMLDVGGKYIYVYSYVYDSNPGARLMQYDTLGNQKWSVPVGDVRAMLADEEGNCYIAPVNVESTLIKYNTTGEVVWSKPVTGQFIEGMSKRGDSIFVCGRLKLGSPENQLCAFSIMSARTGEIIYQQSISVHQPATVPEHFSQIASDGKNIYVGGVYGSQTKTCFLLKLSREGNTTGIDENNTVSSFSIYPNPSGSRFTITCNNHANSVVSVIVRNISGQVVFNREITCNDDRTFTLDLAKLAAGNYAVEIQAGAQRTVKKIVVE